MPKSFRKDYTGQRFWYLTAVSPVKKGDNRSIIWKWKCDCGKYKDAYPYAVKAGRVKSCGCKTYFLQNGYRRLPEDEAPFRQLLRAYKQGAKNRGFSFDLSESEFRIITKANCYYCGDSPSQHYNIRKDGDDYIYNGIDRLDSKKGYYLENCVPCCGICNKMKSDSRFQDFLEKVMSIYKKHSYTNMLLESEI